MGTWSLMVMAAAQTLELSLLPLRVSRGYQAIIKSDLGPFIEVERDDDGD